MDKYVLNADQIVDRKIDTPDVMLANLGELFCEKGKEYGHTYLQFGRVAQSLFPKGLSLNSESDFRRFALFVMNISGRR